MTSRLVDRCVRLSVPPSRAPIENGTLEDWRPGTLQEWHALACTFLSSDLKCSPVASSPTRASDSVRVATWLPSGPPSEGGTCPGATEYCHRLDYAHPLTCYARRLELGRPSLGRKTVTRLETWTALGLGEKITLAAAIIDAAYRSQVEPGPLSTHAGHPVERPILRIGAGGDLATREDGEAWAAALHWAGIYRPTLRAWIYSRSYGLDPGAADPLGPIADGIRRGSITNTAAYLSTDPDMTDRTRRALRGRYSHLAVAVLADDHAQGAAILEELRRPNRPLVCPVDREVRTWRTADRRPGDPYASGACSRCRACIEPTGRRTWQQDVIFPRR